MTQINQGTPSKVHPIIMGLYFITGLAGFWAGVVYILRSYKDIQSIWIAIICFVIFYLAECGAAGKNPFHPWRKK